ncbi:MAG: hypothetical protein IPO76_06915 [Elusimicrobia bacterium]|nr:hypothetical protein [Elusimicrobiota bacterium]
MMKRGESLLIDVVVGGVLLTAAVVTWQRLELSNRWAWARESRKAETGEGAVFEYQRIENCPLGQGRTEKKLRRTVGNPGTEGTTFKLHETPPGRTGPRARRPHVYSMFFPSSYADATRDGDRDLVALAARPLELPTGTYFTVRRSREGNMSHGDTEGSHPHRTVTYEWYSPRSPAALLTYTREAGTAGMDNPPTRLEDLPENVYYEWEMLESVRSSDIGGDEPAEMEPISHAEGETQ